MQTFLPYPNFTESAQCLDRQRLGKQRVEALQILRALRFGGAWANHPATRMWRGHEDLLCVYGIEICREWRSRGYDDSLLLSFIDLLKTVTGSSDPTWLGNEDFHRAHRSNLLRKDSVWYGQFGWDVPDNLPYVWPR